MSTQMTWIDFALLVAVGLAAVDGVFIALLARAPGDEASGTRFGLPIGSALPAFEVESMASAIVSDHDMRGCLMLFIGNQCHSCHPLAEALAGSDRAAPITVVVVDEPDAGQRNLADEVSEAAATVIYDPGRVLADRLAMPGVPFIYAIGPDGNVRAKHPVNELPEIERLVIHTRRSA